MTETVAERLTRLHNERLAKENPPQEDMSAFADHIPAAEYERSDDDLKLDTVIGAIDIVTGYRKWINKSVITTGASSRRDGIKVSCPVPGHADRHPSAWLNSDKNVWFCAACDTGGDVYDLAAFYHGYPVPGYKSGTTFHELRRKMAMDFGYSFTSVPGSAIPVIIAPEGDADTEPLAAPTTLSVVPDADTLIIDIREPSVDAEDAEVIELYGDEIDATTIPLDWRTIVPGGTFLHKYMTLTSLDDVPEEYHFWNAMTALGFALGRTTAGYDQVPFFGNLFICTIGDTGSGKSKAKRHLSTLLDSALRFEPLDPMPSGVMVIQGAASAEVLIQAFDHAPSDPSIPKVFDASIKGLIEFSELSQMTGRSERQGNVLKPTLQQFYDADPMISTRSMTSKIKTARYPFASAHTTTQPKMMSKLVHQSDADSGFLNRWFFASGVPKRRVSIGGTVIDIAPAVMPLQVIQKYYEGLGGTDAHNPNQLAWEDSAFTMFDEFYHDVIEPAKVADEGGMLARLDLFYKKITLLYTANLMSAKIPSEAVQQMIACHPYVLACYGVPTKRLHDTTFSTVEDDIFLYLRKHHDTGSVTSGALVKFVKRKGHQSDMIDKVLKILVSTGQIHLDQASTGKRGRPTVRYSLAV